MTSSGVPDETRADVLRGELVRALRLQQQLEAVIPYLREQIEEVDARSDTSSEAGLLPDTKEGGCERHKNEANPLFDEAVAKFEVAS